MPSYKLIYFNARGRGENARMMLTLSGQKFEDVRLTKEEWLEYKPSTPFGQLPLLEVDGVTLCQSTAIDKFLAKRLGFDGDDDIVSAKIQMLMGCLEDFYMPLVKLFDPQTQEEEKIKVRKDYVKDVLPGYLSKVDNFVETDKYIFGNKMTLADITFHNSIQILRSFGVECNLPPKVQAVYINVEAHPVIAEYMSQRPVTEF